MLTALRKVLFLAGVAILLAGAVDAQITPLAFRPIQAEFSSALDRIVMISATPNVLHVYDPATNTDKTVALGKPPIQFSLRPDGIYAVVAHESLLSLVNLNSLAVEKTFPTDQQEPYAVLSTDYIYLLPRRGGEYVSIQISTGSATTFLSRYISGGRLHSSQTAIYTTRDGIVPNDVLRVDVSSGPIATSPTDSRYHDNYPACGPLWFSRDGDRIFTACNGMYRASSEPALDMTYMGTLPFTANILSLSESASTKQFAVLTGSPTPYPQEWVLVDGSSFNELGRFRLTDFSIAGTSYPARGRWLSFNTAGTIVYALVQADVSAGLLNDFAIQAYNLGNPSACNPLLSRSAATIIAPGSISSVEIRSEPSCIYKAVANADWITLTSNATGSGNRTLGFLARRNTGVARTATIRVGSQTFTVNQDAAEPVTALNRIPYKVVDAEYSKVLDALVFVSNSPDELHIFNSAAVTERVVPLPAPALSVSVQPDKPFAVVGHDGFVSYVNLDSGGIVKNYLIGADAKDTVLASNGYVYVFPAQSFSNLYSLEIATGKVTATHGTYLGRKARLHSGGEYLYVGDEYHSSKWRISNGVMEQFSQGLGLVAQMCGNLWLSEFGERLFTACGGVYRTSVTSQQDLELVASFGVPGVTWAAHSAARGQTAIIPRDPTTPPVFDSFIQMYRDVDVTLLGQHPLPPISLGGTNYPGRGRFAFWNSAATRLIVLEKADAGTGFESDWAVFSLNPDAPACIFTLSPQQFTFGPQGGTGKVDVNTQAGCAWQPAASGSVDLINPTSRTGSGAFEFSVPPNSSSVDRQARIDIGGKSVQIQQAALTTVLLNPTEATFSVTGGNNFFYVDTPSATTAWSAVSDSAWITLGQSSATGGGTVTYTVASNSGAARVGRITVKGEIFTVIQEGNPNIGLRFKPITPCRLLETRPEYNFEGRTGAFGPPYLNANEHRILTPPQSTLCNIPPTARALMLNVTIVPRGTGVDHVTVWPGNLARPQTWTVRSPDGLVVANSTIVRTGFGGTIGLYASNATDLVIDVSGYFTDDPQVSNLVYYPMNPCRVIDTRSVYRPEVGPFGPPSMLALQSRRFKFPQTPYCSIPANAAAYSVTMTVVPHGPLPFVTAWPSGGSQPNVSSINSPQGRILANSMVIPAGTEGGLDVLAFSQTDFLIDINGYFAPDDGKTGLYYYPAPNYCRIGDTTVNVAGAAIGPPALADESSRTLNIHSNFCAAIPENVKAYAINLTALPDGSPMPFLTVWPTGAGMPNASQLNAFEGQTVSNSAIVPAGTNGSINVFAFRKTNLMVDLSGYFAR